MNKRHHEFSINRHYRWVGRLLLLLGLGGLLALGLLPHWAWAQSATLPSRNAIISLAVMPGAPDKVLASGTSTPDPPGVYRSTNGGVARARASDGLAEGSSASPD
ncbi:MAG: hypothetical protein R2867_22090 [Caldilineaceae bacterium]